MEDERHHNTDDNAQGCVSCIKTEVWKRLAGWEVEDRRTGKSSYRQQYKVCGSEKGDRQKAVYCSNVDDNKRNNGACVPNLPDFYMHDLI